MASVLSHDGPLEVAFWATATPGRDIAANARRVAARRIDTPLTAVWHGEDIRSNVFSTLTPNIAQAAEMFTSGTSTWTVYLPGMPASTELKVG